MLPLLKAQSRIDRTDEDAQAQEIMARAIGRVERQCGICIAPAEFSWMPRDPTQAVASEAVPPQFWQNVEMPVRGFHTVTGEDGDGVAVTYTMGGDADQLAFGRAWIHRQPSGMQPS